MSAKIIKVVVSRKWMLSFNAGSCVRCAGSRGCGSHISKLISTHELRMTHALTLHKYLTHQKILSFLRIRLECPLSETINGGFRSIVSLREETLGCHDKLNL